MLICILIGFIPNGKSTHGIKILIKYKNIRSKIEKKIIEVMTK